MIGPPRAARATAVALGVLLAAAPALEAQSGWTVAPAPGAALSRASLASADSSFRVTYSCPARHGVPGFRFDAARPFLVVGHDEDLGSDYTDLEIRFDDGRPVIVRSLVAGPSATRSTPAPEAVSGFPASTGLVEALVASERMSIEWRSGTAFRTSRFALPPDTRAVLNQVRQTCGRSPL
jgi:hypothetical protein